MKASILSIATLLSLATAAPTAYQVVLFSEQNYKGSSITLQHKPTTFKCVNIPSSFNDKTRSLTVVNENNNDKGRKTCNFYTDLNCAGQQHSYTFTTSFSVGAVPAAFDKKYSAFSCGATA